MQEKCYFLSDLHLGSAEEPKSLVLLNFLKQFHSREQITHLFLLGDIFDLWVSKHQYFIDKFKPIVDEWIRLQKLGVEIHYFEGNHDLYLNDYFGQALGFSVHAGPAYFRLCGREMRIEHGDQMDLTDYGYRALRWFWRTPVMNWLAPRLPASFVVRLGENMSRASRAKNNQALSYGHFTAEQAQQLMLRHVQRVLPERPFDLFISGHIHVPLDFKVSPNVRALNLGSWFDLPRALFLSASDLTWVDPGV